MEAYLLFGLLCAATGAMVMILACGYIDIEEQRRLEQARREQNLTNLVPSERFFASPRAAGPAPEPSAVDDRVVIRLEEYLRREHRLASEFVAEPSVEKLYQQADRPALMN